MPSFFHLLNAGLMIALPIVLGVFLTRRFGLGWRLLGVGAVTFVASQAVHLPLNAGLTALFANRALGLPAPPEAWRLLVNAVVLGLTAGLCEEIARYLVYRVWLKSARTWREALVFGAGHGGIEAMLLGGLVGITFVNMVAVRHLDPAALPVPAEQQALAAQQIAAYWSAPWHTVLLGALERAFALCFHLSAAVLVLQAVIRRNALWLVGAILWHAAVNAAAVFAVGTWGPYWTEAVIGVFALVSLAAVFALKPAHEELMAPPVVVLPSVAPTPAVDPAADLRRKVDESRYQ